MVLDNIDQLGPREFLEHVLQTPNSEDWVAKSADRVGMAIGLIFTAIQTSFTGPFYTLLNTYQYITSGLSGCKHDFVLIKDWAQKISDPETKRKVFHIVSTTERLAKNMGLGNVPIHWVDLPDVEAETVSFMNRYFIRINFEIATYSDEEIEFIIAHELAHLQHGDMLKTLALGWLMMGVQLVAFRYLNIKRALGAGAVIRGVGEHIRSHVQIYKEKAADEKAMQVLNSNVGMIKYIHRQLKLNYKIKHISKEEFQQAQPQGDWEKFEYEQDDFTPQGNRRYDFVHPPFTERLAHALSFRPQPS
jgi:Peptidase family M48